MDTPANDFIIIFDKVLKFLSFRSRSELEIKEYLLRKSCSLELIEEIIAKLKHLNFINDEEFARSWIQSRTGFRPEGRALILMELRKKGISKDILDKVFPEERPASQENMLAEKLALKKLERIKNLPFLEQKKKLYSSLSQKGFSFDVIFTIVDKLLKKE